MDREPKEGQPRHDLIRFMAGFLLLALLFMPWPRLAMAETLHVAAASNFRSTFTRLARLFEAQSGHRVLTSYASTGKLYAQVRAGAPYALFLAADKAYPDRLRREGLTVGSTVVYALGKLVLWHPEARPIEERGDTTLPALEKMQRLAISNPKTAPYGRAARETLISLGQWRRMQPRLIYGENVGQTLTFAASGNVEAGFVALSQVLDEEGDVRGHPWLVPEAHYRPIRQGAVLLRPSERQPAARTLMAFLISAPAREMIRRMGYGTPDLQEGRE
ncbi:MAG: molybdate ABC transporter substrate-binding protein [Magnetococcales bacterium]|nr:molybdate ABC transporter substrate-binding protein [Magnetococcales bacterium]